MLYSQKGTEEDFIEDDLSVTATIELTYIDIPVLLQYEAGSAGSARPHFYAGPSIGINIACDVSGAGGGISVSADCDESEIEVETLDLGAVIGAGLSLPLAGLDATFGARYQHGLSDIAKDTKVRNRVISVYASMEFGRR